MNIEKEKEKKQIEATQSKIIDKRDSLYRHFIGGTLGGMAQVIVGHPFDTIKVRLQAEGLNAYKNAFDCLIKTVKYEGISSLYRGATSPLIGIGFCNAILFATNKKILEMSREKIQNSNIRNMTCGALSGIIVSLFNCPIELIKIKLQIRHETRKMNLMTCIGNIYKEFGLIGFYRGYLMTLLRDFPSFAMYFGTFEYLMSLGNSNFWPFIAGGFAGIAAWCVCYPQDVVKSRLQSNHSISIGEIFRDLMGKRAFFRGFGPVLLRAFPANAATFLAYHAFVKNNLI